MKLETDSKAQFYGLLLFSFGPALIASLFIWLGSWHPGPVSSHRLIFKIGYELTSLALLAWILHDQGKRFTSIRLFLPPTLADIGHSVLLFIGASIGNGWMYFCLHLIAYLTAGRWPHRTWDISAALFGNTITFLPFLLCIINPFAEELIVRGFLITQTERIYGSTKAAAIVSVVFQTSYHLYQGLLNAITLSPSFTLFTAYFVRKRRILPVVIAHLYMDLTAVSLYSYFLHRGIHLK